MPCHKPFSYVYFYFSSFCYGDFILVSVSSVLLSFQKALTFCWTLWLNERGLWCVRECKGTERTVDWCVPASESVKEPKRMFLHKVERVYLKCYVILAESRTVEWKWGKRLVESKLSVPWPEWLILLHFLHIFSNWQSQFILCTPFIL